MSKEFLTQKKAAAKLDKTATSEEFATKSSLISMGANPSKLTNYADLQYPIDDDIEKAFVPTVYGLSINVHLSINDNTNLLEKLEPPFYLGEIGKIVDAHSL